MDIGFFIAVTVISLVWSIDWKHYVRYYKKTDCIWSVGNVIVLRIFFLVCFAGSLIQLIVEIIKHHPTLRDFGYSTLDSLLVLAIFFGLDAVFRWYWGKSK
jgi:hypothetical protein